MVKRTVIEYRDNPDPAGDPVPTRVEVDDEPRREPLAKTVSAVYYQSPDAPDEESGWYAQCHDRLGLDWEWGPYPTRAACVAAFPAAGS